MKLTNYNEKLNLLNLGVQNDFLDIRAVGTVEPDENYQSGDIPIGYTLIEFIMSGRARILYNDEISEIQQGDLLIFSPEEKFEYECDRKHPLHKYWFVIRGRYLDSLISLYRINDSLTVVRSSECCNIMESIVHFISEFGIHEKKLCHMLLDLFDAAYGINADPETPLPEQIRCVLNRHLEKPIKVSDVAAYFCRSPRHIERVFEGAFGMTVHKYLLEQRFAAACLELRRTDEMIYVIAERFQLGSPGFFAKEFRKRFCMTPNEYRKRFKNGSIISDTDINIETIYDYVPYVMPK